jgi:hypothetical protein
MADQEEPAAVDAVENEPAEDVEEIDTHGEDYHAARSAALSRSEAANYAQAFKVIEKTDQDGEE